MKILKYEKKKNGMYQVFFDNGYDVDLHEEIILKNQLLIKKETTEEFLNQMLDENKKYIAYDLAIKYMSKMMRCSKEIRQYLLKNNFDDNIISEVLKILEKNGYLNDDLYATSYVNDKILLSCDGPNKIKDTLIELEINESSIYLALEKFSDNIQKEKITKIVEKSIKTNRNKSVAVLKNKIMQKLYLLGYDKSIVVDVIDSVKFVDDKGAYKIQYKKVYDKLSKKYSGKELEYYVNQKMYSLGFRGNME